MIKDIIKTLLFSRPVSLPKAKGTITVMGNGPSLDPMKTRGDVMAVNMFAITDYFIRVKPKYYMLLDSAFFNGQVNLTRLFLGLNRCNWWMTLFLPMAAKDSKLTRSLCNSKINIVYYNSTGVSYHFLYKAKLGMPRPQNVLISALMVSIWLGYKKIYMMGADHSWHKDLKTDGMISDSHFYGSALLRWKKPDGSPRMIADYFSAWAIVFKSYHAVQRFALRRGVSIVNTMDSYIDAFIKI